jgi:hypothetical protein
LVNFLILNHPGVLALQLYTSRSALLTYFQGRKKRRKGDKKIKDREKDSWGVGRGREEKEKKVEKGSNF